MDEKLIPFLQKTESGRVGRFERFSHYVARQIGFEDLNKCPKLCNLVNNYLKKSEGCESSIYEYLSNEPEADNLYVKLIEEFERCILSYFCFHWSQTDTMINYVLCNDDTEKKLKLKDYVFTATRKQRFERAVNNLKVTRVFNTLVEEMKAIGLTPSTSGADEAKCTEVMVPVAHHKRSPVLLLMGGGMGAGKSTVLKEILKEPFWSAAEANAVVVEADAFKETDVIYNALSSRGHHGDMLPTAELVHKSSTDAASSLLVTALNEGRDVIMDGTLSWVPFVEQTINMARNVHKCRYRMGAGYQLAADGKVTETYWEKNEGENDAKQDKDRKPYRIELVGVVCDAYLAVVRGIRRAIMIKRAVRVNSQLRSHKRFAGAFRNYCQLVDNARLYCTNAIGGPPQLIGWKDGNSRLLVDVEEIECLNILGDLNEEAESIYQLHNDHTPLYNSGSVWKEMVLSPLRPNIQMDLKAAILKSEAVVAAS
ncbi:unnamed protein product [Amaranthus hypochondriacus]